MDYYTSKLLRDTCKSMAYYQIFESAENNTERKQFGEQGAKF